jgi:diguanylate cyclase (GGDEF)-like protein/PAS domain S-box-containing protein
VKLSFKYRFIISFVLLEVIFLSMIAIVNFSSINKTSKRFIDSAIFSQTVLSTELFMTPLAIYDVATIDDITKKMVILDDRVLSVVVYDAQDSVMSSYSTKYDSVLNVEKISKDIVVDDIKIGRVDIVMSFAETQNMIDDNLNNILMIIIIEVIVSIILSWIVGHKVANSLNSLSEYAEELADNLDRTIPKIDGAIELQILSSTMEGMRKNLLQDKFDLQRYQELVDDNIIISRTDLKGRIEYVSEAFCEISGYSKDELIGQNHNIVRHPDMPKKLYKDMWDNIQSDNSWSGEIKNLRKDGSDYWVKATISPWIDQDGQKIGYIGIRLDICDKKKVEKLAITDRLTQIYNRIKLDEVISAQLEVSSVNNRAFSLIIIDIDHFKSVNDTYGHQVGDIVLKETVDVINSSIRSEDIFGRWGGEEFLIIAPSTDKKTAIILANRIRKNIAKFEFTTVGRKTASFGVTSYQSGDSDESMIQRADEALYMAKESGRDRVESL